MAAARHGGPRTMSATQDDDGHRTIEVEWLVKALKTDGPAAVLDASGIPVPGAAWNLAIIPGSPMPDADPWAFALPGLRARIHEEKEGDPTRWWKLGQKFTTRPPDSKTCADYVPEDPLLEPQVVTGAFSKEKVEATKDRFGEPILYSSHEMVRGALVEFDDSNPSISILQNVADLELPLLSSMKNTLNDAPLWGFPARAIKFVPARWEKLYYGNCFSYYRRGLDFEINIYEDPDSPGDYLSGWDRDFTDEGTKVLLGYWVSADGDGATFSIEADADGGVITADLISGGTGYPPLVNIVLPMIQGTDGRGCNLVVHTDQGGVVDEMLFIGTPGWGYTDDTPVPTGKHSGWALDDGFGSVPDWTNPSSFMRATDRAGNTMRMILNGMGCPISDDMEPGNVHVEKYEESNFLLLGIPTSL